MMHDKRWIRSFLAGVSVLGFVACGGGAPAGGAVADPTESTLTPVKPTTSSACSSSDSGSLCLALKLVSYSDGSSTVADRTGAEALVRGINGVWSQCGIGFVLEDYEAIEPKNVGLDYGTVNMVDLPRIRLDLGSDHQLLVVLTGKWATAGDINDSGANAWTTLPGNSPYGAIIEKPVATNERLVAHELGHYLSLLHVHDASSLMNPVIHAGSRKLTSPQCQRARSTAITDWARMIRT